MKRYILLVLGLLSLTVLNNYGQDLCKDYLLLDGFEPIKKIGFDTTKNWWAMTEPIQGSVRLIINGKETGVFKSIREPKFSPNGERWAVFANDNVSMKLISNDSVITFKTGTPSEIFFSGNSEEIIYSYKKAEIEIIHTKYAKIEILNRTGQMFTDYFGTKVACIGKRGSSFVINNNGIESDYFDAIKPIGFWSTGEFLYAAKTGNGWELYKDSKVISEIYKDIAEFKINLEGTVAVVSVKNNANKYQVLLISDEYYEPIIGKPYDKVSNLALHPQLALYAYNASNALNKYVVYNSAEYAGATETGKPYFTYDGNDMFYTGCDFDCFVSINGKRYNVMNALSVGQEFALAPGTETIAYSTSTSLVVKKLNAKDLHAGMMVDQITAPRYNRFEKRYEALGTINNRLYLLTCKPK